MTEKESAENINEEHKNETEAEIITEEAGTASDNVLEQSPEMLQDAGAAHDIIFHAGREPHGDKTEISLQLGTNFTLPLSHHISSIIGHDPRKTVDSTETTFDTRMGESSVQTGPRGSFTLYPGNTVIGGEVMKYYVPDFLPHTVRTKAVMRQGTATIDEWFDAVITPSFPDAPLSRQTSFVGRANILTKDDKMFVQLGNTMTVRPFDAGFSATFRASIKSAAGNGQIGIMQFMRGGITYYRDNGYTVVADTGGTWFLDKRTDAPALTYGDKGAKPITSVSPVEIAMNDSPFFELPNGIKKIVWDEMFHTHLVYKNTAPGSRWASLGFIEWRWSGSLGKENVAGPWPTTFTTAPRVYDTRFVASADLPEWHGQTGELTERINKEISSVVGNFRIQEWKRPAQPGRQMAITTSSPTSAQQKAAIENAVGCSISKISYGPNVCFVWVPPEMANEAKKVAGVVKVEELALAGRYSPRAYKVPAESAYIIWVAPFLFYNDNAKDMQFASIAANQTLDEVGADLVNICRNHGINGVEVSERSFSMLNLVFPAPVTNDAVLWAMAAHPQVNFVERKSAHITDEDPLNPIS